MLYGCIAGINYRLADECRKGSSMKCINCGREVDSGASFCSHCGEPVGGVVSLDGDNYSHYGDVCKEEKIGVGWAILSFLIPLAGLIIFLVKRDKKPRTAKVSGICALVSFTINILISLGLCVWILLGSRGESLIVDDSNESYSTVEDMTVLTPDEDYEEYNEKDSIEKDEAVQDMLDNILENSGTLEEDSNTEVTTSNDWKSYQVVVNGNNLSLPCSYSDLVSATGFSLKSSDEKSYCPAGYYALLNLYKNEKLALYIEVLNSTDSDKLYTDCAVTRVSQSNYQVKNGADVIVFPGSLKVGDSITLEEIKGMFGEPTDINEYVDGDYSSYTYTYSEDAYTSTNSYKVKIINGVIDELQLDHRHYE